MLWVHFLSQPMTFSPFSRARSGPRGPSLTRADPLHIPLSPSLIGGPTKLGSSSTPVTPVSPPPCVNASVSTQDHAHYRPQSPLDAPQSTDRCKIVLMFTFVASELMPAHDLHFWPSSRPIKGSTPFAIPSLCSHHSPSSPIPFTLPEI